MKLVLFDIDGTLVHSGGQAKPVFARAMVEAFGSAGPIDAYDFSGKTDGRIVVDLALAAGIAEATVHERMPGLRESYVRGLAAAFDPAKATILPGVAALLDALAARDDVAVGLLTGNWRGGAEVKLGAVGLWERFPFGSFGDDGLDRRELPPVALRRAGEHSGRTFRPEDTLIVGDSPLDVDCARAHGIACLAVATGWTAAPTLVAEGATWVVDDLAGAASHPAFSPNGAR